MSAPLFSIVTPVYEPPLDVLGDTIASVLAQDFESWEWILVDDCSPTEAVRALIREHAARDPRIRLVERETNGHIVAASNDGIDAARGEFIVLLDHDDLLTPGALSANARQVARARRRRLPLLRRGQGRRRRQPLRRVPQARLVSRAPARPDVHLPPVGHAHRRRAPRRRVPRGLRRLPGPRPRAPRRRGGTSGRPHPRGALPLASRRRVGVGRHQRQALRHDRRRQRRAGPHGPSRARRRGRSGTGPGALPGHPPARPRRYGCRSSSRPSGSPTSSGARDG